MAEANASLPQIHTIRASQPLPAYSHSFGLAMLSRRNCASKA
jgi:hypothetical protein